MKYYLLTNAEESRWTLTSMIEDIDFADDISLLSSNANHLQKKTNDLNLNAMK